MKVIEQLSALLKKHNIQGVELSEVVELKMSAEGKLADGTMVATPSDSFVESAELYVIDADGNPQPAPDGEYILEDGTKIVAANGIIASVEPAATEEPAAEEMSADIAAVIAAMDEQLTEIKNQLNASNTELSAIKQELSAAKSDLIKANAKVTELSKQPAASSVKKEVTKESQVKLSTNNSNNKHRFLDMIVAAKNK